MIGPTASAVKAVRSQKSEAAPVRTASLLLPHVVDEMRCAQAEVRDQSFFSVMTVVPSCLALASLVSPGLAPFTR